MNVNFGLLSTHPPTECGLATFNAALAEHLAASTGSGQVGIVRIAGHDEPPAVDRRVLHTWPAGSRTGCDGAASALNSHDVVIIQHEYGIYPGRDGEEILALMARLDVPAVVILHTVLAAPTARQKQILEEIAAASDRVVTMTETARDRLLCAYDVDRTKVVVIPHGANDHGQRQRSAPGGRPAHLLTWGLLGPGKGLEWALRALARLSTLPNAPTYTIAGKTHPKVILEQGERYRQDLERLVDTLGIGSQVSFDARYRDNAALTRLIRSADVVVLPYSSTEQVTSGVLIEALAAGVPVVATAFPHAVEAVTGGRGLVVPHADPVALAGAIRRVLMEPMLSGVSRSAAGDRVVAPLWPVVAQRYVALAREVLADRVPVAVSS